MHYFLENIWYVNYVKTGIKIHCVVLIKFANKRMDTKQFSFNKS